MNAIQTYYPQKYIMDTKEELKTLLKFSLLSSYLVNKHYGNVTLYTNDEMSKIFGEFIPFYSEINTSVLESNSHNFRGNPEYYAVPKLYVFSDMSKPFIHLDLDTFIFENPIKLKIDRPKFFVGHLDFGFTEEMYLREIQAYELYYKQILDNVKSNGIWDNSIIDDIAFKRIINANIIGGYDHQTISQGYRKIIDNFEQNKQFYNQQKFVSLFLEQMMFFPVSKTINPNIEIERICKDGIYFNHSINGDIITFNTNNGKISNVSFNLGDVDGIGKFLIEKEFGGIFHYGNYKGHKFYLDIILNYIKNHPTLGVHYKRIDDEF
jgi:hypothetical protein